MEPGTAETMGDRSLYLELLGECAWPATMAFPELAYYVSFLGRFMLYPMQVHIAAAWHVLGYLIAHKTDKITYGGKLKLPMGLETYPDNFHVSNGTFSSSDSSRNTRVKPQGGHVVMRSNAAILWSSQAFKIVIADSTTHAETAELSRCSKSTMYIRMTLEGIKRPVVGPSALLGDNRAADILVNKEGASSRSRHFERATVFVKYMVLRLVVKCFLVRTFHMIADIFTKATDEETFHRMRHELRNSSPAVIAADKNSGKTARLGAMLAKLSQRLGM